MNRFKLIFLNPEGETVVFKPYVPTFQAALAWFEKNVRQPATLISIELIGP